MAFVIKETSKLYIEQKKVIAIVVKMCKQKQTFFEVHEIITQRVIDETD